MTADVPCATSCGTCIAVDPRHALNLIAAAWTCPACATDPQPNPIERTQ